MTLHKVWEWFRHGITEVLFGKDLDEAYDMGMRIGAEYAAFKMGFAVRNQQKLTMTKTEQRGYDYAMKAVQEVKPDIAKKTGARL